MLTSDQIREAIKAIADYCQREASLCRDDAVQRELEQTAELLTNRRMVNGIVSDVLNRQSLLT